MKPKIEICERCRHFADNQRVDAGPESVAFAFNFHVDGDWADWHKSEKDESQPIYVCLVAEKGKENVCYKKQKKLIQYDEFEIPAACPYILEHTVKV